MSRRREPFEKCDGVTAFVRLLGWRDGTGKRNARLAPAAIHPDLRFQVLACKRPEKASMGPLLDNSGLERDSGGLPRRYRGFNGAAAR